LRGTYTQNLLNDYGIANTWVTGCPSLLKSGSIPPEISNVRNELDFSRVIIQGTRHEDSNSIFSESACNRLNLDIYRYGFIKNVSILLQSEVPDIHLAMSRDLDINTETKIVEFLTSIYLSDADSIKTYIRNKAKLFWNLEEWFGYLPKYQYLIGTRIHGVISAILSGIPATLIKHDERTAELASQIGLPVIDLKTIGKFDEEFIEKSYMECNFSEFNRKRNEYHDNFLHFFEENDIKCSLRRNNA
jgi:hypothetical protein